MQYPPPGKGFLGFRPPPNGSHLPTHGFQPWEMGSDNLVHPANPSIASAAPGIPNPYPCPVVPNQRFLANTMGTFSQPDSSSFDLTPSRPLAGITCTPPFPSISPMHGNNYINVINFEKSDGCAKGVWVWFWPVDSKESPMPPKNDEPILSQRPKASAIVCCLCWAKENWKAYKLCDGVMTTLCNHLKNQHHDIYEGYRRTSACEAEQHWDKHGGQEWVSRVRL